LKEKLLDCAQTSDKNKELYEKYQIVKQKAQMSLNHQQGFLNEIKEFNKIKDETYKEELEEKKTRFKELEYKVFKIKSETVEIERNMETIKHKLKEIAKTIKNVKERNKKLKTDKNILMKGYNTEKIKMLRLFKQFEVKSLEEVVHLFNDESRFYNTRYSQVNS
jgi:chromosome segregation ATPase